ncbi:MAG: DUF2975 domain-containing protein [Hyphomonadaceae bacterium]
MKALGKGSVASIVKGELDVFWVLLWIGAVALTIAILASLGLSFAAWNGFLPANQIGPGGGFSLPFDDGERLDWRFMIPALWIGAAVTAGWLVIVWRMKRIFASFTAGEPFSTDNARHLRIIWIALLEVEIAQWAVAWIFGAILLGRDVPFGPFEQIRPDLNLMNWAAILIIFVLAEIFREGARLREEQALTI